MKFFSSLRGNKKAEAKGGRLRLAIEMALGLILAAPLLYVDWPRAIEIARRTEDAVLDHELFSVHEIKVKGGEKVGGSEIVAMAGLSQGVSIWRVDPAAIEKKVARHRWVGRVLVRREFPRRVVIEVEEREAKAIAALGKLYYVDRDGYIFKAVEEGERTDFTLLTGLKQEDLRYPTSFTTRQRIQEALGLNDLMAKDAFALSEIHFLPGEGLIVYPVGRRVALSMGSGNWEDKLKRLARVLELWKGNEDRLAILDLSFRNQVIARLRKG
ncbi:MAG TPA: FtsQ-type POTRA domain-containing protein [Candidatus Binatia bacterium]